MVWLPIVICLAAFALVIGPVMLMQPTPSQRREASLRKAAEGMGLRVQILPINTPLGKQTSHLGVCYSFAWPSVKSMPDTWELIQKKYVHDIHAFGDWDWNIKPNFDVPKDIESRLKELSPKVYAVICTPQFLGCFWSELGTSDEVFEIGEWLKSAAIMLGKKTDA
jgi:hypothetical protein